MSALLPDNLQAALAKGAAQYTNTILYSVFAYPAFYQPSATFDAVLRHIRVNLDATLALAARNRNAALSRQARLPDALWGRVWELLPLEERTGILRVCQHWHAAALRVPPLWADIDVRSADLRCVPAALARSGREPLVLRLDPHSDMCVCDARRLAHALRPHSARLVALHADMDDTRALGVLLGELRDLSALRVLTSTSESTNSYLPALESPWPALPVLGRLTIPANFLSILHACPCLEHLHVLWCATRVPEDVRACVPRVHTVHVSGVSRAQEDAVLALFSDFSRPALWLDYAADAPELGLGILAHIRDCLALTCARDGGTVVLAARRGADGRQRALSFPARHAQQRLETLWEDVPPSTLGALTALTVDACLWPLLVRGLACAPALRRLTLVFDDQRTGVVAPPDAAFPALRDLVLRGPPPPAHVLVRFLESLRLPEPLETICGYAGDPLGTNLLLVFAKRTLRDVELPADDVRGPVMLV